MVLIGFIICLACCYRWLSTGFRYSWTLAGCPGLWIMAFYGSYLRNCPDFHLGRLLLLLCQKVRLQTFLYFFSTKCSLILYCNKEKKKKTIINVLNFILRFAVFLVVSLSSVFHLEWCNGDPLGPCSVAQSHLKINLTRQCGFYIV